MTSLIDLLQVSRTLAGHPVLEGVSASLEPEGGLVSLIGAPGSGKSLLAAIALGHVPPDAGEVTLDGGPPPVGGPAPGQVGWVPTRVPDPGARVEAFHAAVRRAAPTWDEGLWRVALGDLDGSRSARDLGRVDRARLALAAAVAPRPPLVWCDDPARELEGPGREAFADAFGKVLERLDATVVVAARSRDASLARGHAVRHRWRLVDGRLQVQAGEDA